ncbi:G-type lectin S-receptor-like serine/threonine-protein kinase CES101, partial [Mucuna pruriens]
MGFNKRIVSFITLTCLLHLTSPSNLNRDTLLQGHQLTTSDSLVSTSGMFTLSFFQVNNTQDFYLGIRLSESNSSYFWIANRDNPIHDPAVVLTIDQNGTLKFVSNGGKGINSTLVLYSIAAAASNNSIGVTLQDAGNFVLREMNLDGTVKRNLWQSFDYPSQTIIPGMKVGFDRKTGQNWTITSWRSDESPSSGSFTLGIDPNTKQLVMWWRGKIVWTSGAWKNGSFTNLKSSIYENDFVFSYYSDENATYVTYVPVFGYLVLRPSGSILGESGASYSCIGKYFLSGCTMPSPPKCRDVDSLDLGSWSSYGIMSGKGYVFDQRENLSNFDCWIKCLSNCSCQAYSYVNQDQTGCQIWTKATTNFLPTNNSTTGARQIYFIRTPKGKTSRIWIISAIAGALLLIFLCFACIKLWRKLKERAEKRRTRKNLLSDIGRNTAISIAYGERREQRKDGKTSDEMYIFNFQTILEATTNFSSTNKIGEGGFGPVYKGKLPNGQEIAIKRLSKSSGQGLIEFKNEAMLIVKLQHTNLVRLLGFCIDKEERILVYEYMPNKSLNLYLFDSDERSKLEWKIRCRIIQGVAQGLVYLHQYSRLKVIHRDLKASNILLDNELNPKISDFGMARIFQQSENDQEQTNRIVEYAMMGVISTKIDVYSFGVLLLEIVSGKKNSNNYPLNLVVYAWKLWNEGEALKLMDTTLDGSCPPIQLLRYINIGLLCTQDQARERPTMIEVVSYLSNEIAELPQPKKPGFCTIESVEQINQQHRSSSLNGLTSSLTSAESNNSTISAILQENGNFMLREMNQDGSMKRRLWQSFDYPTNVDIRGMKLGFDRETGHDRETSWRSDKSPLSGSFTLGLDNKAKQLVMWWRGNIVWSSEPWNNGSFANLKSPLYENDFVFNYFWDENETYVTYICSNWLHITTFSLDVQCISHQCNSWNSRPTHLMLHMQNSENNMHIFDFQTILEEATANFSSINKIGKGGFGPVYQYAMMGVISTKTSVYSFCILLLEILTRKKISNDYHSILFMSNRAINEGYKYVMSLALDVSYSPTQVLSESYWSIMHTRSSKRQTHYA